MKNKFTFLLAAFFSFAFGLSSCSKIDDLYDETNKETSPLFDDGTVIPSGFNWSSTKTVSVNITVDDQFGGQYFYRVELYDNDPVFGTGANLLAAGQAKQGQNFTGQIVVPTALTYVYLKQTSPVGVSSVTMLEVGSSASVGVSNVASVANEKLALSSNALGRMAAVNLSATTISTTLSASSTSVAVPSDAIELRDDVAYDWSTVNNNSNKSYVIKTGTTFTKEFLLNNGISGIKVYVQGTWENSSLTLGSNSAIYVVDGGKFNVGTLTQNSQGTFENYGTSTLSNMTIANAALFKNSGTLKVTGSAKIDNGSFTNYGAAIFEELSTTTNSTIIRNEATLTIKKAVVQNATIEAVCHTTIDNLIVSGQSPKVYISEGAILSIGALSADGTHIYLAESSILDVSGTASFSSNRNYMEGTGMGTALARLKRVDVQDKWQAITYSGKLEVACSDHTANGQYSTYYILTSPATIVPYDKSTVVIASTSCNAGGNNASSGTPTDQTVTDVDLGTYSYAFEDNWPTFGDYDMNDFVTDINIVKTQNSANKVTKVALKAKLRSVGASKRLAAALQLDGVSAGNVKSVTYSRTDLVGSSLLLGATGVESGQTYAVLPICDDAHKAFGITNTDFISTQNGNYSPVDIVITIEFNTALESFSYNTLNVFIINYLQNTGGRNEIHLVGYKATDKMNNSLVSYQTEKVGQLSVGDPFKSHDGYPWGLCIPVSFVYPAEGKNISAVYAKFKTWATSGGIQGADWYIKN